MFSNEQERLIVEVEQIAKAAGAKVYLVGGFVRDLLRGIDCGDQDIDFVVEGNAIEFAKLIVGKLGGTLKIFPDFYTAKILNPAGYGEVVEVDFASTRTEIYARPGALPAVSVANIEEDLKRRDFTVNAMAIPLQKLKQWIDDGSNPSSIKALVLDLFGGKRDLEQKCIRIIHEQSFIDDPTRIFRGVRYEARLQGAFEARTEALAREGVSQGVMQSISEQRRLNEIKKIFTETNSITCLRRLKDLGALTSVNIIPIDSEGCWETLDRLAKLRLVDRDGFAYEVALRIFFHFTQADAREKIYRGFGFGKASFKAWVRELESVRDSSPTNRSDVVLALETLLNKDRADSGKRELSDRKLSIA